MDKRVGECRIPSIQPALFHVLDTHAYLDHLFKTGSSPPSEDIFNSEGARRPTDAGANAWAVAANERSQKHNFIMTMSSPALAAIEITTRKRWKSTESLLII